MPTQTSTVPGTMAASHIHRMRIAEMKVAVKRVDGGHESNWRCDNATVGGDLEVLLSAGTFVPASLDETVVLVAGGSGITPVIAIAKSILFGGTRDVVLVYANRDQDSVIFATELRESESRFPEPFPVIHIPASVQDSPRGNPVDARIATARPCSRYLWPDTR